ncbi:DUF1700 domain-containing protein [Clostridium estertheticum]|uniref:DUF1700 domain-containing protein n=1 Tax=Clostridium estertheticum TaxID=238834 RepID=UPI001C0B9E93|nr:DUF1700 domain-containing protein [Clostridium estertheticum]MBU3173574.1 DUF1700 domain-containing protein [Clostridium estertheticum]
MNKKEFLSNLTKQLSSLGETECNKFTTYYSEMIDDYIEDGYTESQAIDKIGDHKSIAKNIIEDQGNIILRESSVGRKVLQIVLLILGFPLWGSILSVIILLVLCGCVIFLCIPLVTGVIALTGLCGGLWSIAGSFFCLKQGVHIVVTQIGFGFLLLGIGVLCELITQFTFVKYLNVTKLFIQKISYTFRKKMVRI